jgi:hypothetical protein
MAIRKIQRLRELPRVHGRRSDLANLAGLHYVVQLKRFFDRRPVIPAVDSIQVHVVGSETTQALVAFIKDLFAREALASSSRIWACTLIAMTTASRRACALSGFY